MKIAVLCANGKAGQFIVNANFPFFGKIPLVLFS